MVFVTRLYSFLFLPGGGRYNVCGEENQVGNRGRGTTEEGNNPYPSLKYKVLNQIKVGTCHELYLGQNLIFNCSFYESTCVLKRDVRYNILCFKNSFDFFLEHVIMDEEGNKGRKVKQWVKGGKWGQNRKKRKRRIKRGGGIFFRFNFFFFFQNF